MLNNRVPALPQEPRLSIKDLLNGDEVTLPWRHPLLLRIRKPKSRKTGFYPGEKGFDHLLFYRFNYELFVNTQTTLWSKNGRPIVSR